MVNIRGGLTQAYGQIMIGFLTEAIVKYDMFKEKKSRRDISRSFGQLESLVIELESPYHGVKLDPGLKESNDDRPWVSSNVLRNQFKRYCMDYKIEFNEDILISVMNDLIYKLHLLEVAKVRGSGKKKEIIYSINVDLFEGKKKGVSIDDNCHSLYDGLSNGLISRAEHSFESNEDLLKAYRCIAKEILWVLGSAGSMKNLGKGYVGATLYNKLHKTGMDFNDFIAVSDALISHGVIISAYSPEFGMNVLSINPAETPFRMTQALIEAHKGRKIALHKVENPDLMDLGDPMGSYISIGKSPDAKEFYHFSGRSGI
jgi:hypothetical protein